MSDFSDLTEEYATLAVYISEKEAELKMLNEVKDKMKAAMLAMMAEIGIKNAKSVDGHAVCMVANLSTKVEDREAWMNFVFEQGDDTFITNHVAKEAIEKYMDEHEGEAPPGVKVETINSLRFTKAK